METDIVVFLPTYNERENLPVLVERLFSFNIDVSILIVDDESPDGTGKIADQLAEQYENRIRVIHRQGARGRGKAGIVGLREASQSSSRLVVEMDADLSHDPEELPRLLKRAEEADLVIGSRYIEGGGAEKFGVLRSLNSKVARWLSILILGLHYTDPTSGYRVYRREILEQLPWDSMISVGPSIVEETLYHIQQRNGTIVEEPIIYKERRSGTTKITPSIILKWIMDLVRIKKAAKSSLEKNIS